MPCVSNLHLDAVLIRLPQFLVVTRRQVHRIITRNPPSDLVHYVLCLRLKGDSPPEPIFGSAAKLDRTAPSHN